MELNEDKLLENYYKEKEQSISIGRKRFREKVKCRNKTYLRSSKIPISNAKTNAKMYIITFLIKIINNEEEINPFQITKNLI